MSNQQKVKFTFTLWLAVIAGAFVLRFGVVAEGVGVFRGMERGLAFIIALFLAGVIALQCKNYAQLLPKGDLLRRLGYVPLWTTFLIMAIGVFTVFRGLSYAVGGAV